MERLRQLILFVSALINLLEALQQDFITAIGDNIEIKFSTNKTTFKEAVLTYISNNDTRTIFADGAIVWTKYRVKQITADSLSIVVDSVNFSEAGNYVYTFNRTTVAVIRVTVLDPKPTCTIIKRAYGSVSNSPEYMLIECTFTYSGRVAPLLRWTEDALIDIGFESSSCWAYEQNVSCKIPFRFYQAVREDVLNNALQSGSMNTVATFSEGCNQYKCYWEREWNTTGMGYTIRLDSSRKRSLGTLQCVVHVSSCRILKRTIRSSCEEQRGKLLEEVGDKRIQQMGLIGAVTALSLIVVVFGGLLVSACIKNQYLKRRIDFYIDMEHQKRSKSESNLLTSASPPEVSENRAQVQLVSYRSIDQPDTSFEISDSTRGAYESIRRSPTQPGSMVIEPVELPPMPLPARAASARRSHPAQRDNEPRVPDRTTDDSSRNSEPPISSTEYMKLTQREPLQLPTYAGLSQEQKTEQASAENPDSDSGSTGYINLPKKCRSRSEYINISKIV